MRVGYGKQQLVLSEPGGNGIGLKREEVQSEETPRGGQWSKTRGMTG